MEVPRINYRIDLINSSPSRSRESSPSSSSEIYRSTETLYDELNTSDTQDKVSTEGLESDETKKYEGLERDILSKKEKLKLSIKSIKQIDPNCNSYVAIPDK